MIGLPRADDDPDPSTVSQGVARTVAKIRESLVHGEGPKLRLLPENVTVPEILAQIPEPLVLPRGGGDMILGVEESRLGPLLFNTRAESHLYLFGDGKTGKTTFLRSIISEVTRLYTPGEAKIMSIDMRRTLMGAIPKDYQLGYLTNHSEAMKQMRELAAFLRTRLPGSDVTPEQIRDRSWWSGPEVWILVDDYDLVATTSGNPLMELIDLLPQAADIGLHVIITRRMGGASRAAYEKVLQMMNDLAVTGILLSGNPSEGAIINGVKPKRAVPGPTRRSSTVSSAWSLPSWRTPHPHQSDPFVDTATRSSHMIDQSESRRKYVLSRVPSRMCGHLVPAARCRRAVGLLPLRWGGSKATDISKLPNIPQGQKQQLVQQMQSASAIRRSRSPRRPSP